VKTVKLREDCPAIGGPQEGELEARLIVKFEEVDDRATRSLLSNRKVRRPQAAHGFASAFNPSVHWQLKRFCASPDSQVVAKELNPDDSAKHPVSTIEWPARTSEQNAAGPS
jgi:hypothetical protein